MNWAFPPITRLLELAADAPIGADIREYLAERQQVPDQADAEQLWADCLSVYGVAREVHAITGAPLAPAPVAR